ncbi:hypothetical protein LCGC14_1132950 [marine sediment metagenome]|uniref:DNA helicase DnaB-like N-terminal domain-containing protein n=1 Tax=marine sediment metagenome TaxID=412755 RepID=A0A0F9MND9_9ZZZZ
MPRQEPHNKEAESRLLAAAIALPEEAIPKVRGIGLGPEDFFVPSCSKIWDAITGLYDVNSPVNLATVEHWLKDDWKQVEGIALLLPDISGREAEHWAKQVLSYSIKRAELSAARALGNSAYDMDIDSQKQIAEIQRELDRISSKIVRMKNPTVENPAEALRRTKAWNTNTGVACLDQLVRYVSSELDFIAGDPGCGKSSIANAAAAHTARRLKIPSVLILAESDALDSQLSMLLTTGDPRIDALFVSRVRYDPNYRTDSNIKVIEEMWNEYYHDIPLRIYEVETGVDEVISIVSSITEESFIQVDHAYGVVSQTGLTKGIQEHQNYVNLFSRLKRAGQRNNHCTIMYNQFKLSGREGDERGPDAQYGGSGIRNIAASIIHLWPLDSDALNSSRGYRAMAAKCHKVRARLVEGVDPVGMEIYYRFLPSHRQVFSEEEYKEIRDKQMPSATIH